MRLEDWQKYIESEFLDENQANEIASREKTGKKVEAPTGGVPVPIAEKISVETSPEKPPEGDAKKSDSPDSPPQIASLKREKEEGNHTPTLRLKRRRNLTSAEPVAAFEISSFPSVSDSEEANGAQYLLLQSSVKVEESEGGSEAVENSSGAHPALNSPSSSQTAPRETSLATPHKAQKKSRPPLNLEDDIPSFAAYMPTSRKAAAQPTEIQSAIETRGEIEVETPRLQTPRRRIERTLSLPLSMGSAPSTEANASYLKSLQVLQRIQMEDSLRASETNGESARRQHLLEKLLNPELTLDETAHLLKVCPTTVRRYTNQGVLKHHRKGLEGVAETEAESFKTKQRRFRLLDVLEFLDSQSSATKA